MGPTNIMVVLIEETQIQGEDNMKTWDGKGALYRLRAEDWKVQLRHFDPRLSPAVTK